MNERTKKVLNIIKKANKLGIDINKITEGKSIETLSRSKVTVGNLEKRFKRQKERPKILELVRKIDEKRFRKQIEKNLEGRKGYISKGVKNYAKNFLKNKVDNELLVNATSDELDKFFNRYFKQISYDADAIELFNNIKKRFGLRIDLAFEFMDKVYKMNFKYEIEREKLRTESPEDFNQMLKDRLEEFERILITEFDL